MGLELDSSKYELGTPGHQTTIEVILTTNLFHGNFPDVNILTDSQILLSGAPVSEASNKPAFESKVQNLRLMSERLTCLEPLHGLPSSKNYFSRPKLQCILEASPAYKNRDALHEFYQLKQSTLNQIINIRINERS